MSMLRILPALVVGLVAMLTSAQAAPVSAGPELAQASQSMSEVSQVQWRRGYYGGWGYRRGPWIGLGVGAGIVAGAIIADRYYRPRPGYYYDDYAYDGPYYRPAGYGGDPRVLCAENFRSFEWRTGLYTTYGGERRLCPYLR
jgi:BA14K-like protein